jgi:hypothetical protein
MRYKDFDLKLDGTRAKGYSVEVIDSPVRWRSEAVPLVLSGGAIPEPPQGFGGWPVAQSASRSLGEALFKSLFPAPIKSLWERSEQSLEAQDIMRLRLDIRAPGLAALPWESIHDGSYHLALSPRRPVVRFFFDRPEVYPTESRGPLNILLAASTPSDVTQLPAVEKELELACACLGELKDAGIVGRVEVLRGASMKKLQRELRQPYHALHYVGHGEFAQDTGHLILEDDEGRARRVSAQTLSYFFRDTSLRLLFLNACQTASPSMSSAPLGVAHAALAAGVPAVIAMQDVIRDDMATLFAHEFYQTLAEGHTLEACVAEGRKAVLADLPPGSTDWAIPVLFSNAREGLLWKTPEAKEDAQAPVNDIEKVESPSAKPTESKSISFGQVEVSGQMVVGDGNTSTMYLNTGTGGAKNKKR